MIYFIQEENSVYIKIGYTASKPHKRLNALQTGNPHRLTLLAFCKGGPSLEKKIHRDLIKSHVRGEWYSFDEDVRGYIDNLLAENTAIRFNSGASKLWGLNVYQTLDSVTFIAKSIKISIDKNSSNVEIEKNALVSKGFKHKEA